MADRSRPLLPLPQGRSSAYRAPPRPGGGRESSPKKNRVLARLWPKFHELERVLDARRAELAENTTGASPEQILVFETTSAGATPFIEALRQTELAWLAGHDRDDVEPDRDYFDKQDPDRLLTTRLFMVMANIMAMDQLLTLWKRWRRGDPIGSKHTAWLKAFKCLRDVRYWGPKDRVEDTGLLEDWRERVRYPITEFVPVEIELWFRGADTRSAAAARVQAAVAQAGGEVFDSVVIEEIAYHALLVGMPITAVEDLLRDQNVALAKSHDVHLFRPVPQQPGRTQADAMPDEAEPPNSPRVAARGEPTVALLDGLPLQRHELLDGRLIVEDPEDWEADYPSAARRHGTAMASLIVHGDLGRTKDPSLRPLYVRPILRPVDGRQYEESPPKRLWIDVIHRAVLRLVGTTGVPPTAPEVRVVNLSIGDLYRPFVREISPLARLLDWLAWKYKLLFVVSAGNHGELIVEDGGDAMEHRALQAMQAEQRHRRLLSPAESINALTVGAQPLDDAGDWTARYDEEVELIVTATLPSAISALGRGFRGAVKPELLAPGGRVVFVRSLDNAREHAPSYDRARIGPGQLTAAPGRQGDLTAREYSTGTSNSAALVSRAAMRVLEVIRDLQRSNLELRAIPEALLVKSLLVHTSTWDDSAYEILARALRTPSNASVFKDHAAAFLGYGSLREERALECELHRATLIGGGEVALEAAVEHRVPLPASLNAYTRARRVIVTLAWFSPVTPSHRKYRVAALAAVVGGQAGLAVTNKDVHGHAMKRGTLQHCVLQGARAAARVGVSDELVITVSAAPDAPGGTGMLIPYALAVTVEVDAETPIPVYEEVAARVRSRVRSRAP